MRDSTPQVKQALIGGAFAFVIALLSGVGGCWRISSENSQLKARLSATNDLMHTQEAQLATLRHDNQSLVIENSRYKTVMNPIERKAKEIYPELETSAAMAKLAKDLEDTRNLAMRGEFKPLTPELRERIVSDLKRIQSDFAAEKITLSISYLSGSISRSKLAQELSDILKQSGATVNFQGSATYMTENFETPVRVFVSSNGSAKMEKLYRETVKAIAPFLTSGFVPMWNSAMTNQIDFQVMGIPAFLPNGSVIFE